MRVREVIPVGKSDEKTETMEREKREKCGEGWREAVLSELSAVLSFIITTSIIKKWPAATYCSDSLYLCKPTCDLFALAQVP